ncbi:MAG: carboxypeptidase regulatory-like domain-containing protein [Burkholderiales bacterium]|nr:carboxypeptidase regulatory-like domain-containing protein [Burkholderiales bacterium]
MRMLSTLLVACALCQVAPVAALTQHTTSRGEPAVSGGIGAEEIEVLRQQRSRYSLRILTAARGSGAYLAGVMVTVADTRGTVLLEARADGPWMMLMLKPGEYRVTVRYEGAAQERRTQIDKDGSRELVFYFNEAVERLPKGATE